MEKDQAGNIIKFDVGDVIEFKGKKYKVGPSSARNFNEMLDITQKGIPKEVLRKARFSLRRNDGCGYMSSETSLLDFFSQLPVDLSKLR